MQNLNLAGQDPDDHFNGSRDDIGDWFQDRQGGSVAADGPTLANCIVR